MRRSRRRTIRLDGSAHWRSSMARTSGPCAQRSSTIGDELLGDPILELRSLGEAWEANSASRLPPKEVRDHVAPLIAAVGALERIRDHAERSPALELVG